MNGVKELIVRLKSESKDCFSLSFDNQAASVDVPKEVYDAVKVGTRVTVTYEFHI